MILRVLSITAALTLAASARAQSTDPDLVATSISFPPALSQGATAPVTLTVRNNGLSDARPFDVSVALTRDGGVCTQLNYCDESDDDWFVGTAPVSAGLAAGAEVSITVQIAIPADFATTTWNLFGVVDGPVLHDSGNVFESNERNNTTFGGSIQIVAPPTGDPDLVTTAISFPPVLAQGATAPVAVTVRNDGFSAAKPFAVSVALTRDGGVCTQLIYCDESDDDWFVGTASVSSELAPGAEITVTVQIAIPADLEPTSWNLFGVADGPVLHGYGKVFETSETNNTTFGGPILITSP